MEIRQEIPLKLKLIRFKNSNFFSFIDKIIYFIKPPKKFKGVPEKILFFRNDRIGDAVCTLPVLRDLKLNYPDLRIHLICSDKNKFVFENLEYIDKLIIFNPENWNEENLPSVFKIPILGKLLQFIFHFFIPYLFDSGFKEVINNFKNEKYDAVIDLIGRRRIAIMGKMISRFTVGSRLFGLSWMYSYYMKTNWVSPLDDDFMSRKIQGVLEDSLNFDFAKKDESLPYFKTAQSVDKKTDIFIHLGTGTIRRFTVDKEMKIIEQFKNFRVIITDGYETENFKQLKRFFLNTSNIEFKLYKNLQEIVPDILSSRLMLSYDGGQTHFLSQLIPSIVIFGPGSAGLWKPYEFKNYNIVKEWENDLRIIESEGVHKHCVIYKKIWCSPCFDAGCKERPCLAAVTPEIIFNTIKEKLAAIND